MKMMKLFAAAHQTGGRDEVLNYMSRLQSMLSNIDGSIEALVNINSELDAALDVALATCCPSPLWPAGRPRPQPWTCRNDRSSHTTC